MLTKETEGTAGARAFKVNIEMATVALDPKFGVTKHRIVTHISYIVEDNQTKYQYV